MKRKTQERMERRSRKRSSSAGSEKMEKDKEKWRVELSARRMVGFAYRKHSLGG